MSDDKPKTRSLEEMGISVRRRPDGSVALYDDEGNRINPAPARFDPLWAHLASCPLCRTVAPARPGFFARVEPCAEALRLRAQAAGS